MREVLSMPVKFVGQYENPAAAARQGQDVFEAIFANRSGISAQASSVDFVEQAIAARYKRGEQPDLVLHLLLLTRPDGPLPEFGQARLALAVAALPSAKSLGAMGTHAQLAREPRPGRKPAPRGCATRVHSAGTCGSDARRPRQRPNSAKPRPAIPNSTSMATKADCPIHSADSSCKALAGWLGNMTTETFS